MNSPRLLSAAFALLLAGRAWGQSPYPKLGSLGPDDSIYRQHQEQLAASYAALQRGKQPPELLIFSYAVPTSIDLLSLAARLNLPYETIATLNRLDRIREFVPGERLLVPSLPGLFASPDPRSDLDLLLSYRSAGGEGYRSVAVDPGSGATRLLFYPGSRFTPEERALFLGLLFRFPLPVGTISSGYGYRTSPITGKFARHDGIDLAAPAGTEVYAAREGKVEAAGFDSTLGNYVIIAHAGGWSTVYGHLARRTVGLNDNVESGMIIGIVGSTGLSTGNHLHFEVRNRGEPRNPEPLMPQGKR